MYENNLCPGEAETAKRCGKIASTYGSEASPQELLGSLSFCAFPCIPRMV